MTIKSKLIAIDYVGDGDDDTLSWWDLIPYLNYL